MTFPKCGTRMNERVANKGVWWEGNVEPDSHAPRLSRGLGDGVAFLWVTILRTPRNMRSAWLETPPPHLCELLLEPLCKVGLTTTDEQRSEQVRTLQQTLR